MDDYRRTSPIADKNSYRPGSRGPITKTTKNERITRGNSNALGCTDRRAHLGAITRRRFSGLIFLRFAETPFAQHRARTSLGSGDGRLREWS